MEPTPPVATGVEPHPSPAPPGGGLHTSLPSPSKSTPEQRAKWRENWRKRKQRPAGPVVDRLPPAPSPTPDAGPAPVAGGGAVPWDANVVRPLFEQLIPALEKVDVQTLREAASKADEAIRPTLVALVEKDAAWHPAAKQTLIVSGAEVSAKWLNRAGLSAEHAPEVALAGAVLAIFTGRQLLAAKIAELTQKPCPPPSTPAS